MATIQEHRHPELQRIYSGAHDRRRMTRASTAEYDAHWRKLNRIVEVRR